MHSKNEILRLKAIYEDMIYYNDYHLGKLIERLKELHLFDDALIILTGDHGESFGEHSANGHGGAPFDEQINIPLIMKFPHSQFRGRIDGLVQHIDLTPTILETAGVSNGFGFQGKSLFPLLKEGKSVNDFVFIETQIKKKFPKYTALRTLEYKYILIGPGDFTLQRSLFKTLSPLRYVFGDRKLLFHLGRDPAELINIRRRERQVAEGFQSCVETIQRDCEGRSQDVKKEKRAETAGDEEVSRQLQALGYFDE